MVNMMKSHMVKAREALTESEIMRVAPSVFAESAHESRGPRYQYIPTIDVLRGLMKEGFQPYAVTQSRTRIEGKQGHTKHMLRLRHADFIQTVGETVSEVILLNSHDGTSSYHMTAGCFRFVCSNGMVVADSLLESVKVRHSGKVQAEVIQGAFRVMDAFAAIDESRDSMQHLQLSDGEQRAFAGAALALRYGTEEIPPISAEQVNTARRWDDRGDSLWTTFQRAQENLVQGGLRSSNRERRTTTRAVNGIDGNVALNRGLWVLAEEMRKLRAAA